MGNTILPVNSVKAYASFLTVHDEPSIQAYE